MPKRWRRRGSSLILSILLASLLAGCVVVIKNNWGHHIYIDKDYADSDLALKQEYEADIKTGAIRKK